MHMRRLSRLLVLMAILTVFVTGCGGGGGGTSVSGSSTPGSHLVPLPASPVVTLTKAEVANIVQASATAAAPTTMVIAVVDRAGNILAVWRKPDAPTHALGNFNMLIDTNDLAVGLARTGAFFSNNQAPLTSRTVRFIRRIHLPPCVTN